jgi:hypothetical protein
MPILEKLMQEKKEEKEELGENCKGGVITISDVFFLLCSH